MGRKVNRLTAKAVANQTKPGYYPDGLGLYLQVSPSKSKSWIFRYTLKGKSREMGLGSETSVSLAEARRKAAAARSLLADGIDPIEARQARSAQEALAGAKAVSFQKCAEAYIESHRAGWKNKKHAAQWTSTLATYVYPTLGALPVSSIDTTMVVNTLEPIWNAKPETASRVRGRIESVLDWAAARGYRSGENPARWRGHLDKLLPTIKKTLRVRHHPALPYQEIGEFMHNLRGMQGTAARALEFLILNQSRTIEVIGATPAEFDLKKALWIVPAQRMKAGKEHRVPLAPRSVEIITEQLKLNEPFVFPGGKPQKPLSSMAMLKLLERMDREDLTVHGFRSTFRDWGAEQTAYPAEVLEMALAHTVGDKVEAAYRRGDLFEKRRRLAQDWARYCEQSMKAGKATPIRKSG